MGALYAFDLTQFINQFGLKFYFETGTGEAVSLRHALRYDFDGFYSVDIDEELIANATPLIQQHPNLLLLNGKSKDILIKYAPSLPKEPFLFFLDAHFPGADFHKVTYEESIRQYKKDAFPLEDEIRTIIESRDVSRDVFIIDDFILYEPEGDYDTIKQGIVWRYGWLQEELGLQTNASFLYDIFNNTHDLYKDTRHQGYLVITPKA